MKHEHLVPKKTYRLKTTEPWTISLIIADIKRMDGPNWCIVFFGLVLLVNNYCSHSLQSVSYEHVMNMQPSFVEDIVN